VKTIVILISGRGSNMEAILRARLPVRVACVISNEPDAKGLATANAQGVATVVVPHRGFRDRAEFDAALAAAIDVHQPDLIVLAGFMRILSDGFIARYQGRLMNIHPSLLPSFPGLHTHRHALAAGVRIHGCTVHFVTSAVDRGPIIAQAAVPVVAGESEEALSARVLREEHRIYPQAIRWFCEGRLTLSPDGAVTVHGARAGENALRSPVVE